MWPQNFPNHDPIKTGVLDRCFGFIRNWPDLTNEGYNKLVSKGDA